MDFNIIYNLMFVFWNQWKKTEAGAENAAGDVKLF